MYRRADLTATSALSTAICGEEDAMCKECGCETSTTTEKK